MSEDPPAAAGQGRAEAELAEAGPAEAGLADEGAWLRLHPLSWLVGIAGRVRAVIFGVLALGFAGRTGMVIAVVALASAAVAPLLRQLTFRYRLTDEGLLVKEGLLQRTQRRIPWDRIQNVDTVRSPVHRLFKVTVARIETGSGGKPEAVLDALSPGAADELRQRAASEQALPDHAADDDASDAVAAPAWHTVLTLSAAELARLGVISNRGVVVIGAALAFAVEYLDFFDLEDLARRVPDWIAGFDPQQLKVDGEPMLVAAVSVVVALAAAVIALTLLYTLSIAVNMVRFWGFRLAQRGGDLRTEFGLLTRISVTTPRRRIQRLTSHATPLHRIFGRVTIRVDSAGGGGPGGDDQGVSRNRRWLAPLAPIKRHRELIGTALPEIDFDSVEWRPIQWLAWRRLAIRWILLIALVASLLAIFRGPVHLAWLLLIPVVVQAARRWVRFRHWGLTDNAIWFKRGAWWRTWTVVRLSKVQSVRVRQSVFDRRRAMAHLEVDAAGTGGLSFALEIPFLHENEASGLARHLNREASRHALQWG